MAQPKLGGGLGDSLKKSVNTPANRNRDASIDANKGRNKLA